MTKNTRSYLFLFAAIAVTSFPLYAARDEVRKVEITTEPIPWLGGGLVEDAKAQADQDRMFWGPIDHDAEEEQIRDESVVDTDPDTQVDAPTPVNFTPFVKEDPTPTHNRRVIKIRTEPIPEYIGNFPFLTRVDDIPSVSHLDERYSNRRIRPLPATSTCRQDWNRLRQKRVVEFDLKDMAPYEEIAANARRAAIPEDHLERTMAVFFQNQKDIPNQRYIGMIDFNKHESRRRLFVVDLKTGKVSGFMMAHGQGSDPGNTGYARRFSNSNNTLASTLGCAIAGSEGYGARGRRILTLHGIEKTNDYMCDREIVMHPAHYVSSGGRSHGCPALRHSDVEPIFSTLKNGGLICSHYDGEELAWEKRVKHIKKSKKFNKYKKGKSYKNSKKRKHRRR